MPRADKRQQIMRAAQQLLRDRHLHEVTLDEVAHRAKVGKGTIYRYFGDKEDLFLQTAMAGFDDLGALVRQVPAEGPFEDRLRTACLRIIDYFEQRQSLLRMIQIEEGRATAGRGRLRARWLERRGQLVRTMSDLLQDGIDQGVLRSAIRAELLAGYLLGMLRTRVRELSGASAEDRSPDHILTLFLHGAATER